MTTSCSCNHGAFDQGYRVWDSIVECCEFMLFGLPVQYSVTNLQSVRGSMSARINICFHLCFGCAVSFLKIMIRCSRCFCGQDWDLCAYLAVKQRLSWGCVGSAMWCCTISQDEQLLSQWNLYASCKAEHFVQSLHKSFSRTICLWPEWCDFTAMKSKVLCKCADMIAVKGRSIVRLHNLVARI